jgi:outer membrane protein assembly factor BamB
LNKPSGIALAEGVLYVSDYETGEIIAYSVENGWELARINTGFDGIMGLEVDIDGKLWFVSSKTSEIYRVEPQ